MQPSPLRADSSHPTQDNAAMPTGYAFIAAFVLCTLLHLTTFAVVGTAFRIPVREMTLGFGPQLIRLGRVRIRLLPLGGSVRFKDLSEDGLTEDDLLGALDTQPLWMQLVLALSGGIMLLAVALALLQLEALPTFIHGFAQIVLGALSPAGDAQTFLAQAHQAILQGPFTMLLGGVAAKFAAFNLLPLPATNGGQALAFIGRRLGLARTWPAQLTQLLMLAYLALVLSWAAALVTYVAHQ
ncbi:site-2 protease family protein [Ralstonia sp. 24A2]|uniref:site-2 protease family protein n=1 Tax=Ralstonia sp. 24A2 TaxID=3447364 RepID=UPI003F6A29F0